MRFSLALLSSIAAVMAAPAIVTETDVVLVTAKADPTTTAASAAATPVESPKVGHVYEVVVSELVLIKGDTTTTQESTLTITHDAPAAAAATSATTAPTTEATIPVAKAVETTTPTTSNTPSPTTLQTVQVTPTTQTTPATTETTPTTTKTTAAATTSAAQSTKSDSSLNSADSAILAEHNKYRALHGVSDLSWSSELAAYAQAYADKYDCSGTLTHSGGPYGENLGLGYSTTGVVDAWYSEIKEYNWNSPSASHFTQVVWKSTTQLGCGYKQCGSYWGQYTICSYNPAGNFAGEYSENVLPLV